jgi:hypothetical protein
MSIQSWEELLYASVADSSTIAPAGTTETIIVPDTSLPAGYFYAGRVLHARMAGIMTCASTAGNITMRARWGGVSGTVLAASAALAQANTQSNVDFELDFYITCRQASGATAATGKLLTSGKMFSPAGLTTPWAIIPASANAEVGSLDLRAAGTLSFSLAYSNGNANSMTVQQFTLEAMS